MTKMQKTAKGLDVFFKILQIILIISTGAIAAVLLLFYGFSLSAKGSIMLDFAMMTELELDGLQLLIAPEYAPRGGSILSWLVPLSLLAILLFALSWLIVRIIRKLLGSIIQGLPFYETAWEEIRKLALLVIAIGALNGAGQNMMRYFIYRSYDVQHLLLSDKITAVTPQYSLDLSFLLYGFLLLLLAYVFRYGAELQVQVDETV